MKKTNKKYQTDPCADPNIVEGKGRDPRDNFVCWEDPRPMFGNHAIMNQFEKSPDVANPLPQFPSRSAYAGHKNSESTRSLNHSFKWGYILL